MRANLIVEDGFARPQHFELDAASVVLLGRDQNSTIVLHDPLASRAHARVYAHGGRFWIGHHSTTNGTRIDGEPLDSDAPLADGQLIGIGDVRIRFVQSLGSAPTPRPAPAVAAPPGDTTQLQANDLSALYRFMNDALAEDTPAGLVALALDAALRQTGADLAGYLSLDVDEPDLRLVLPPDASVDRKLSRRLSKRAAADGRAVRLGQAGPPDKNDSLNGFHDALCLPLRAADGETPLGALHVYKTLRPLSDRHLRFCEALGAALATSMHLLRSRRALEADNRRLRDHAPSDDLVGDSAAMATLGRRVSQLAASSCTVLIQGESGTGKELVALALHRNGPRRNGPLVTVNCAAINQSMAESELFGHVKGAFTSAARDHGGFFAQADTGTLFLDEIGELSLDLQAKLLRAIEYRVFRPVGAARDGKADVRILAATNRDLPRQVRDGTFRHDLYYRITARIDVPPLRDHLDDVPALVDHFLGLFAAEYRRRPTLSDAALRRLMTFSWPGNVRQLRSVLEGAVALGGSVIHAGDLNLADDPLSLPAESPSSLNLEALEQWAIRRALAEAGGVRVRAAKLLGIHRETLGEKLRKYHIDVP